MSDALPLPPSPSVPQYGKLAEELHHACQSGDAAIHDWVRRWVETLGRRLDADAERLGRQWRKMQDAAGQTGRCTLAGAQFFIARAHGFASWPEFSEHLEGLARADSAVSNFETAVDAIVNGDAATLRSLLRANPELAQARSGRQHRSTMLHYVSANGVEDFRQKTPKNIVEITNILLDAGADVNAESDAYGGRSTTLHLAATSCHPEEAGLQIPLMELLIKHGAIIDLLDDASAVNGCLHNGRGEAAEFLANHGARLDLEAAAGVGRLDVVRSFFGDDGTLNPPATRKQLTDGFAWACEFGRTRVVGFLLQRGLEVDLKLPHNGQTGLHWAAYGGHADTVKLLLERGAPIGARDESFDGTPLGWALYQWGGSPYWAERGNYYEVVALLVRAGAKLAAEWFEVDDEDRRRTGRKVNADSRMQAALRGETLR